MFVVVLSVLIVVSITEKGPIIFFSLGEAFWGSFDSIILPSSAEPMDGFYPYYYDPKPHLNYTQVLAITEDNLNLAPRI